MRRIYHWYNVAVVYREGEDRSGCGVKSGDVTIRVLELPLNYHDILDAAIRVESFMDRSFLSAELLLYYFCHANASSHHQLCPSQVFSF